MFGLCRYVGQREQTLPRLDQRELAFRQFA
jgi:hypothetical protein